MCEIMLKYLDIYSLENILQQRKYVYITRYIIQYKYLLLGMNWPLALPKLADIQLFYFAFPCWNYRQPKPTDVIGKYRLKFPMSILYFNNYYQSWSPKKPNPSFFWTIFLNQFNPTWQSVHPYIGAYLLSLLEKATLFTIICVELAYFSFTNK